MRSIWSGHIRFGMMTIPAELYKAEDTSDKISFNQLHKEDFGRVGYEKKCKKCGDILSMADIVKGYEYEDDTYVIVEQEDINNIKIKSTKIVEISGFLDKHDVSVVQYDNSYFIGPKGSIATEPYALLREALKQTDKIAVGRIAMRDREHVVVISACDEGLVMYTVMDPKLIRSVSRVAGDAGEAKVDQKLLKLSKEIIEAMKLDVSEIDFSDHYQEALRALIEAKIQGKEVVVTEDVEEEVQPIGIALQQTIKKLAADRSARSSTTNGKKKPANRRSKSRT